MDGLASLKARLDPLIAEPKAVVFGTNILLSQEQIETYQFTDNFSFRVKDVTITNNTQLSGEPQLAYFSLLCSYLHGELVFVPAASVDFSDCIDTDENCGLLFDMPIVTVSEQDLPYHNEAVLNSDCYHGKFRFWDVEDLHTPGKVARI